MLKMQWTILFALVALLLVPTSALAEPQQERIPFDLQTVDPLTIDQELQDQQADCAPPCGYIWPRIGIHTDVQSPYPTSALEDYPREIEVVVTYSWDLEQEGTGINDPAEEMTILLSVTRTPIFLDAELDERVCSFTLLPVVYHYDVCTLTLTVDIHEENFPATEDELRETGHRLMLFAMSDESGTFMTSYGLEDLRFSFDEAPPGVGTAQIEESPAPAVAAWIGVTLLALAAAAIRRRSA